MAPTARRFDDNDLAQVRTRTDLVGLVSDHGVELRRSGTTWKGLCPFHDERTPSFTVRPDEGMWHCFGCGTGGDAIAFAQETQSMGFPEAVRFLAERAGVTLTEEADPAAAAATELRRKVLDANTALHELLVAELGSPAASTARDELTSRGFTQKDALDAGCGYAPADPARTFAWLREHGVTDDTGVIAGFLRRTSDGRVVALFRDRLTWPIKDSTGHVVGFGARRLSETDTMGKYVNSAESPVFHKSDLLFGWDTARKAAVATGRVVVVEGYTDVMAAHASGVFEVVASCGTAFGATHLRTLTRGLPPTVRVVYCFDGDAAGRKAARGAWELSLPIANRCAAITIPDGADPCGVYQAGGPDAVVAALSAERPLTASVLDDAIAAHPDTPEGASLAAAEVTTLVGSIPDQVLRDHYARWAHNQYGTPAPPRVGTHSPPRATNRPTHITGWDRLQRRVARRAVVDPTQVLPHLDAGDITEPAARIVLAQVTETATRVTPAEGPGWTGAVWDTARSTDDLTPARALSVVLGTPDPETTPTSTVITSWLTQSWATRTERRRAELIAELDTATAARQDELWAELVDLDGQP